MIINGIPTVLPAYESTTVQGVTKITTTKGVVTENNQNLQSAVYDKSGDSADNNVVYKQDTATLSQLMADAEKHSQQLRDLVEKMFLKQGQTFDNTNMYQLLREGKVPVDAETSAQAKLDIAEDGYWGVEKTSDRLVSFAKALTGGDPDKAEEMIAAVKKGFEQATKAWGGELPELSQKTFDATLAKLDEWKNSLTNENA